jgi:hypothetical protein
MAIVTGYLLNPDVADQQINADAAAQERQRQEQEIARGEEATSNDKSLRAYSGNSTVTNDTGTSPGHSTIPPSPQRQLRRFYGSVDLDPLRVTRDAGLVANEVLQHLASLVGAEVQVTLEVQVQLPEGVPDHVIRTVSENCRTLKFKTHNFEEE